MNEEYQAQEVSPQEEERRGQRWVYLAAVLLVVVGTAVYTFRDRSDADSGATLDVCASIEMGTSTPRFTAKIIMDDETGRQFVSNNVIVGFSQGVAMADICQLILEQNGRVMQRFTNVPLFLVEVPDEGDGEVARRIAKRFLASDIVDDATLNFLDAPEQATSTEAVESSDPKGGRE